MFDVNEFISLLVSAYYFSISTLMQMSLMTVQIKSIEIPPSLMDTI